MGRKNSKKRKKDQHRVHEQTVKGVLDITRSGMGFVTVENLPEDVIVRPGNFNTAWNGNTVRVKIKHEKKGRRMQGSVTEVLRRKQTEFVGRLEMNDGFGFFIAETDKPM